MQLAKEAGKVKGASWLPAGSPDLHGLLVPLGRSVYLEMKKPAQLGLRWKWIGKPGEPSPEQLTFLLAKHRTGCIVGIVWSLQNALDILTPYLGAHNGHLFGAPSKTKERQYAAVV